MQWISFDPIALNNVDFPAPFLATRQYRCPKLNVALQSLISILDPYDSVILFNSIPDFNTAFYSLAVTSPNLSSTYLLKTESFPFRILLAICASAFSCYF